MNRNQLVILLVLGVVVGGAGFYFYQRDKASYKASDASLGQKLLPDFPINEVAQIAVKQGTNQLNLAREGDTWKVRERHNYPADFSALSEALRKLWEIKTVQSVQVGASQLGRLELTPPGPGPNTGTLIEFKDQGGKILRSLTLGKKYMRESPGGSPFGGGDFPAGRYVMVGGKPEVWLISDPLANLEPKPESWLNKDFVRVEKIRSIAVASTNAADNWKIARETETGEWKLAEPQPGEELDASKVSGLSYAFSSPTFNDVLPPDHPLESVGLDQPVTATLETFDNFVYQVKISQRTNEESLAITVDVHADPAAAARVPGKDEKPEDKERLDKEHKEKADKLKEKLAQEEKFEKWIYLVSKWTVDPLLKHRHDLLAEKKEEKKDDADAAVPPAIPGVPEAKGPPLPGTPPPEAPNPAPKPAPPNLPADPPAEPKKPEGTPAPPKP